jgi:glycosyltransferase involved in cell wall biosynthesis
VLVSIVIPVFNSRVLRELSDRIDTVFRSQPENRYELVLVDDGSTEPETWQTMEQLAAERASVRAIQLTRNFGQQVATLCGLLEARGDSIITMDDDLQHAPEDIPRFLSAVGFDIVIGQFRHKHHSPVRRFTSWLKGHFDRIIIGKPRNIQLTSYRMLSRLVVDGILSIRTANPFLPAMMFHVSSRVASVPVTHHARAGGRSGYTLWKRLRLFSNLLFNNSSLVLRLVGQTGIALAGLSFFLAALAAYRKLAHGVAVRGWTSLFAALLLIGGLLLFSSGVVGEYLIRIIESTEARPLFFVRRRVGRAAAPLEETPSETDLARAGPGGRPSRPS